MQQQSPHRRTPLRLESAHRPKKTRRTSHRQHHPRSRAFRATFLLRTTAEIARRYSLACRSQYLHPSLLREYIPLYPHDRQSRSRSTCSREGIQEIRFARRKYHAPLAQRDGLSTSARSKDNPPKKIPECEAIFANIKAAHARSDADPQTLRLSIDTKAKVKCGEFSRGGKLRCFESVNAWDHDMTSHGTLIPFGILEVKQKQFNVV